MLSKASYNDMGLKELKRLMLAMVVLKGQKDMTVETLDNKIDEIKPKLLKDQVPYQLVQDLEQLNLSPPSRKSSGQDRVEEMVNNPPKNVSSKSSYIFTRHEPKTKTYPDPGSPDLSEFSDSSNSEDDDEKDICPVKNISTSEGIWKCLSNGKGWELEPYNFTEDTITMQIDEEMDIPFCTSLRTSLEEIEIGLDACDDDLKKSMTKKKRSRLASPSKIRHKDKQERQMTNMPRVSIFSQDIRNISCLGGGRINPRSSISFESKLNQTFMGHGPETLETFSFSEHDSSDFLKTID